MTPAEEYAYLSVIKSGIEWAIKGAKERTAAVAGEVGVKTFTTPVGQVTITDPQPSVLIDEAELLKACPPSEVETVKRVRPAYLSALYQPGRLVIVAGEVVDSQTGEAVGWAQAVPAAEGVVTFPHTKPSAKAKAEAKQWVQDRTGELTSGIALALEAS